MTSNATYHQLSPGSQDGEDDRQADDAPLLGEDVTERDPDFVLHADEVEMSVLTSEGRNAEPDLETGQSSSRTARPSPRDRVTNWWSRAPVPTRLGSAALGVLGCLSLTLPSLIEMLDKTQVTVIVPAEYNTIEVDSNYNQDHLTWNTERKGQSLVRHFELPRSRGHEVEVTVEDAEGNKIELGVALSEGIWSAKTKSDIAFEFLQQPSFVKVTITPSSILGMDLVNKEEHWLYCGQATESDSALGDWEPINEGKDIFYRCRIESNRG